MAEFVKGFVCAERTADGPRQFAVDSKAAFNAYVELSEMGSNEADYWGGFRFDLNTDDEGVRDADGNDLDRNKLEKSRVITMAEINRAKAALIGDIVEDQDIDGYDSVYETAFLAVRDGDFRE